MTNTSRTISLPRFLLLPALLALAVSGCVAQADDADETTAEAAAALAAALPPSNDVVAVQTINDGHCVYTIGTAWLSGSLPPNYYVWAYRNPLDATCGGTAGYQILGYSANFLPTAQMVKHPTKALLTVAYDYTSTPSGSAARFVSLVELDGPTLAPIKTATLAAYNYPSAGYVHNTSLRTNGAGHLWADGTVTGTLPGETGSGPNYEAYYAKWFSSASTTPTSIVRF